MISSPGKSKQQLSHNPQSLVLDAQLPLQAWHVPMRAGKQKTVTFQRGGVYALCVLTVLYGGDDKETAGCGQGDEDLQKKSD